jgi:inhibitor of cysteine peptidase
VCIRLVSYPIEPLLLLFVRSIPLFVIDLANHYQPKVAGELKIPGFSNYLHPWSDGLLVGLGKETSELASGAVRTGGVKVSLFDVSDMSQPKEADKIELGGQGSESLALHEHKAVLADRGRGFLVLPMELRDYSSRNYQTTFSGAVVFKIR